MLSSIDNEYHWHHYQVSSLTRQRYRWRINSTKYEISISIHLASFSILSVLELLVPLQTADLQTNGIWTRCVPLVRVEHTTKERKTTTYLCFRVLSSKISILPIRVRPVCRCRTYTTCVHFVPRLITVSRKANVLPGTSV